jgi:hypothetical protein
VPTLVGACAAATFAYESECTDGRASANFQGKTLKVIYQDLHRKLNDHPFKPFRIRLSNSSTIDGRHPRPIIVGECSDVVPTDTVIDDRGHTVARVWKTISISHIVEFIDLNEKDPGPKRKRA